MRQLRMDMTRWITTLCAGGMLMWAGSGCATGMSGRASMTPAQAAQVADEQCAGVPEKERELGLLAYRDGIADVRTLSVAEQVGKVQFAHARGALIEVRAQPGISGPWLGRVAACHMALATAGRGGTGGGNADPLLVSGVSLRVDETATGYVLSVRAPDDGAANEVMRRAQALTTGGTATAMATH